MKIKICGVTNETDVRLVSESGADTVGLLVDMPSQRTLDPERALKLARESAIGVTLLFFDKPREELLRIVETIRPALVQLQGNETPEDVDWLASRAEPPMMKGVHVPATGAGSVDAGAALGLMRTYADAGAKILLLDAFIVENGVKRMGGTGKTYDWNAAREIIASAPRPVFLAGGLTPENVAEAIHLARPYGVDLAGGVEKSKGVKDPDKLARFVAAVRAADKDIA